MRNYLKLKAMYWRSNNGDHLFAFGADDEDLLLHVLDMEAWVNDPPYTRTTPQVIYFLLNEVNLAALLSGSLTIAFEVWKRTRLNAGLFSINDFPNNKFFTITQVKSQGSPRKVWSHGK